MTFSMQGRREFDMIEIMQMWLPSEDVRRDTSHLVTASGTLIKQKLVRRKFKHGSGSARVKSIWVHVISHPNAPKVLLSNNFHSGLNAHALSGYGIESFTSRSLSNLGSLQEAFFKLNA